MQKRALATVLLLACLVAAGASYAATGGVKSAAGSRQVEGRVASSGQGRTTGQVRAWARVTADGKILASGGAPHIDTGDVKQGQGIYNITWGVKLAADCATYASVAQPAEGSSIPFGYAMSGSYRIRAGMSRFVTQVVTLRDFSQGWAPANLGFDVEVVCSPE